MEFKTKKISKDPPKLSIPNPRRKIHVSIPIITSLIIIIILCVGIVKAISKINVGVFLKIAGEELQKDAYNHTNFLILGIGGLNHEGADLTDSMIVASLDYENKLVTMISIPRDIYIKDSTIGNSKINEVYYNAKTYLESSTAGIEYLKTKIEEIMGIPIHYWVKIDFTGFKELIDALGGVDINVEEAIYDPYYPKDGTFLYETFKISAGLHHMDGETALKYARSRKTTSDFDRAKRQQQILYAAKEKALSTNTILDTEKIKRLLNALKANIETNIQVKEILTLGSFASEFSEEDILHRLIHDDPTQCGGFLYTPSREFYNDMFVFLPAGGFNFIHLYSDLNFDYPLIAKENAKIHILNGTKTAGIAGETKQILKRFCFEINRFGNATNRDLAETTYYYKQKYDENGKAIDSRPISLDFLEKIIPGKESTQIPQEYTDAGYMNETDIILEIGNDYVNSNKYMEDPFYSLPDAAPIKPAVTPATVDTTIDTAVDTTPTSAETSPVTTTDPQPQDQPIITPPSTNENQ